MARGKPIPPQREPLRVYSVKLTPAAATLLMQLGQEASDHLGWTVTSSAVMRALVRYAGQRPPAWAIDELHPLIEEEIAGGRVWGKTSKKNKL